MTIQDDIEVLKRILIEPGKWLVIVHLGHIVKVAKVEPEKDAKELARVFPKPALCHAETR
jgi:hypothetical protein